jgi:hypothetical protein
LKQPKPMTGAQLYAAIKKLGFNMQSFGRTIDVRGRTVQGWCGDEYPVPRVVAMLVNLMIDTEATEEHLRP